ncbi:MAG: hypothetical protein QG656_348 [Candidatus Hydrogenedentes bacterium]|nr:hypothetical protein [Candidatus Hydrogenedentota bacterium]
MVFRKVLLLTISIAACSEAVAWGPLTHLYFAKRILRETYNTDILYGAMAPDFAEAIMGNPSLSSDLHYVTHHQFDAVEGSLLGMGLATHNGDWGTDWYAHHYYQDPTDDLYSTVKIRQLSTEFGLTMNSAENVFEGTIDFLIRRDYGLAIGVLMAHCGSGPDYADELAAAFAGPLSSRSGVSLGTADTAIRQAAGLFHTLVGLYGQVLQEDDAILEEYALALIMGYIGCDETAAAQYFTRCIEICEDDYQAELDRIVGLVRAEMWSHGYRLPLDAALLALAMAAVGAWFLWRRRPVKARI